MSKNNPWVLLRGLAREKGHWGPFKDNIGEKLAPAKIICVDLPGAGEFRSETSPHSVQGIFEFVRQKTLAQTGGENFNLLGISLGGMVALEWLVRQPQELNQVVLINTSSKLSSFYQRLRWQVWHEFLRILSIRAPREREKAILDLVMNNEDAKLKAFPHWAMLASEYPMGYKNALAQIYAASRYQVPKTMPEVPVLVLTGLGDRMVDPNCSVRLSEQFHWTLEKHPWAGHDLTWDDPQWVLEKIAKACNISH